MGEVFPSSEDLVLEEIEKEEEKSKGESNVLRWEGFLPRMFLRVLLVEGDDSTRQIIAALLQKCNYKVAAVSDGLKAWEMLKEKPHNIDLILTEVQLPSISGFCLLTMIMGHETCKSIPLIMMSSHDSISIVFKCMMNGAADFLVKPIRKNELRNLWQHVWRRKTSSGMSHGCEDNLIQGKLGATSENNAASNHSSDYMDCGQKNKECSEKGSDAQSSCTKPDMEAESACLNNMQDLLRPKCSSSPAIDTTIHKSEEHVKLGHTPLMHESEAEDKSMRLVSEVTPCNQVFKSTVITLEENHAHARPMTVDEVKASRNYSKDSCMVIEKQVQVEPSREAIDLIGTIENQLHCSYRHTDDTAIIGGFPDYAKNLSDKKVNTQKFGSAPPLELSLRRFEPSGNQDIEERYTLNHSNVSAFSWYNNRTVQHAFPTSTSFIEPQQCTNNTLKPPSNQGPGNAVDTLQCNEVAQNNIKEDNPLVVDPSSQDKMVFPCPQLGIIPVPIPFNGIPFDGLRTGYGALLQPMFYTHPTAHPGPPPWSSDSISPQEANNVNSSTHQFNPKTHNPEKDHPCDQNADKSGYQSGTTQEKYLESREGPKHVPFAPGQSESSSLYNCSRGHLKSSGCGSVCNGSRNVIAAAVTAATSESGNDDGSFTGDQVKVIDCQLVSPREAALTKFRLKRKDRCYEKKVRYQSRKRLAEQRPRVRGQFVRRVQSDSHRPFVETDCFSDLLAS